MSAPTSLLKGARAFASDMPREAMAPGYLWRVVDFVPSLIEAPLTGRSAWVWGSDVGASSEFVAGILAPFSTGEKNLGVAAGTVYEIGPNAPYPITGRGNVPADPIQNPVMLFDQTVWLSGTGASPPVLVGPTGAPVPLAGKPSVKVGTVWGEYFVGANQPGHEDTVYWSAPDDVTLAWDPNALWRTGGAVTGLAAMRNTILVFHASSVERLRGSRPPAGTSKGDMVLEPLFNQVGTTEPKTIAYWQENVIFADEHGVHITDGAVLRNLVQQGQIQSFWRTLYNSKLTLAATVFLDYYVISVRTPFILLTLVCDLGAKQWFSFSNVEAVSMWASGGTVGMERFWGGVFGTHRVGRFSPMFLPNTSGALQQDANDVDVQPIFETPFYKLGEEGRKRIRFAYLSYDARALVPDDLLRLSYILSPQDTAWTQAGLLPSTTGYSRYRLPVGKFPYGIAFQVRQFRPTVVTRISDLAIDGHAAERSRL